MRSVGLKILKNRLSEYVRLAERGETVLVTDRDRVIAEISPPSEGRPRRVNDVELADAVRRGLITPPVASPGTPPGRGPVAPLSAILSELEDDRRER
jgi:antitoxin (DNA-binding transcriptional repressor) of toxin-antitoxin stability system